MTAFLRILLMLCGACASVKVSRTLIHFFQLESYQFPGYFRTIRRSVFRAWWPSIVLGGAQLILMIFVSAFSLLGTAAFGISAIAAGAAMLMLALRIEKEQKAHKEKKRLVLTPRVKRLYGVAVVVFFLLELGLGSMGLWLTALLPACLPYALALAGLLAWPIEKAISEMYFQDARRILKQHPDLIRIGITGSYGKTSVKFILGTLLEEKYQTLVTPASFNTPMGVTKVIRTQLQPAHQVFVAEMGARHVGDIKEMCRLVSPEYGILTSVGPQHLDTFKTLERIKGTKYELIEALPADGAAFFPDDGAVCRELYDKTTKPEKHLCAVSKRGAAEVWAEDIRVSQVGSSFMLCTKDGSIACTTRLLGEHNIQNILLAAMACLHLGLTLRQIARGISRLEPVEHRLQLRPSSGVTIIDDAFNSNPNGASKALHVLNAFIGGKRIIVTPGMVELGEKEADYNRAFGREMAECTDEAILVGGRHAAPIAEGLREKGFPEEHIYLTSDLSEAMAVLNRIGTAGDVALFENDLPDNYTGA